MASDADALQLDEQTLRDSLRIFSAGQSLTVLVNKDHRGGAKKIV